MSVFYGRLAILGWIFTLIVIVAVVIAIYWSRRRSRPQRGFEVQLGRSDEKQP